MTELQPLLTEVTRRLRERGDRMTGPRRAVLTVLAQTAGHLSAEDIQTRAESGRLPASTIYRVLETFGSLGVVQHIHLGHGATAYHLAGPAEPHLHLECRHCGSLTDVPGSLLAPVVAAVETDIGFRIDPTHTALSGRCQRCVQG